MSDTNWRLRGSCVTQRVDPDVMYPDSNAADEFLAKRICNGCPVSTDCFLDSIANRDWEGVRAEMTGKQRKDWFDQNHPDGKQARQRQVAA
ncbi:WhiB family transcriptional regulator [Micromonospora sp. WMMD754]|uniref:WhiB family transcriptional regulator n=1 Tax=Micromonospora sp. WMMD754 TaxID=3404114 RepID=UPI003BF5E7D5